MKGKGISKTRRERNLMKKYEILICGETKKLIKKRDAKHLDIKYVVPFEGLFDALMRCHTAIGHKKRDAMLKECQKQHANLTVHLINSKVFFYIEIRRRLI